MKKINKLNQKLQKLNLEKTNVNSLENTTILQLIKCKIIISKKQKIINQIQQINSMAKKINLSYAEFNESLIANPQINCRKYYKLQKKAEYKKDFELYKLGFLSQKPLPPIIQKIKPFLPQIDFSKYNLFKKLYQKYDYFKSNILPKKINNLAVTTAKLSIQGYKKLQADCIFIKNNLCSKDSFKYIKHVFEEANAQVNSSQNISVSNSNLLSSQELKFRASLKPKPSNNNLQNTNSNKFPTKQDTLEPNL